MKVPVLTIVMPIYNGEKYLREAINSVLGQTFDDYELLIINDGSTDRTMDIISSNTDKRIRILNNPRNLGIARCRNLGLELAKGDFLGWTDCDDLNMPTRFEEQINFLQNNPEYGGCGTWLCRFKGSKIMYVSKALKNPEAINASLLFKPATIPNATVILKMSELRKYKLFYNPDLPIGEDYDFIFRCSQHFKFTNIQKVLYKYRDSETSIMKKFEDEEKKRYNIIKTIYSKALSTLAIQPTEADLQIHDDTCSTKIFDDFSDYQKSYAWLIKIKLANTMENIYNAKALNKVLANQFFFATKKASKFGFKTLYFFIYKSLKNTWGLHPVRIVKLGIRCAIKYDQFEFRKH